jgi:hypothetical protein
MWETTYPLGVDGDDIPPDEDVGCKTLSARCGLESTRKAVEAADRMDDEAYSARIEPMVAGANERGQPIFQQLGFDRSGRASGSKGSNRTKCRELGKELGTADTGRNPRKQTCLMALIYGLHLLHLCGAIRWSCVERQAWMKAKKRDRKKRLKAPGTAQARPTISYPPEVYQPLGMTAEEKKGSLAWVVRQAAQSASNRSDRFGSREGKRPYTAS